jgi:hypothetical protein
MFPFDADPRKLTDGELAEELVGLAEQIDRLRARQVAIAAEFDSRMAYTDDGAVNTAAWLAPRARISRSEAHQIVALGRAQRRMPRTAEAVADGSLSVAQARVMSRSVNDRTADVFAGHEDVLVEQAARLTVDQLARVMRFWEYQADADGLDPAQRLREKRRAYLSTTFNGMGRLEADLDPESAAVVGTVLEEIVQQLWRAEHPDDTGEPPRTTGQRRADALVEMARRASSANDHAPAAQPLISVVTDLDALQGLKGGTAELRVGGVSGDGGGLPVGIETVRRLACDSRVSRIVLGPDSEVLDVGRAARTATPAQRRALVVRDGGCGFRRCDRPPGWCQVHHVVHWADGGTTDLALMLYLCSFHHHLCHEGGWTIHLTETPGRFEFRRPNGTVLG